MEIFSFIDYILSIAIRRLEEAERDGVYGQMSSEPESNGSDHGQNQIEMQDLEENKPEKNRPISYLKQALVQDRDDNDLYSFKGFMFFCFGAPGVSPHWCSKLTGNLPYSGKLWRGS